MKHGHDHPLPTKELSRDVKNNQAADKFVDLFRRVVIEERKESR